MTLETELVKFLVKTFGKDCWDDSVEKTAQRWIEAMKEFAPYSDIEFNETTFPTKVNQLITVTDIEFSSLCAHHLFPFMGTAHVGYVPNALMIGVSKIPRIVHWHAHHPNTQETMAKEIATHLKTLTQAHGVAVVIEATHTCMACRGVRAHNASMITSEMRGVFLSSDAARIEFLNLIHVGGRK